MKAKGKWENIAFNLLLLDWSKIGKLIWLTTLWNFTYVS